MGFRERVPTGGRYSIRFPTHSSSSKLGLRTYYLLLVLTQKLCDILIWAASQGVAQVTLHPRWRRQCPRKGGSPSAPSAHAVPEVADPIPCHNKQPAWLRRQQHAKHAPKATRIAVVGDSALPRGGSKSTGHLASMRSRSPRPRAAARLCGSEATQLYTCCNAHSQAPPKALGIPTTLPR